MLLICRKDTALMKHKGRRTKKIHQKTHKMFFLSYICSLKRQRPVKRMAEILSRFLRAAIARWTLAGVVFSYVFGFFHPFDDKRFTGLDGNICGRPYVWQSWRHAIGLRRLGKNKFIEPAASSLHRLAVGGANPKHRR